MAAHRRSDRSRDDLYAGELRKYASVVAALPGLHACGGNRYDENTISVLNRQAPRHFENRVVRLETDDSIARRHSREPTSGSSKTEPPGRDELPLVQVEMSVGLAAGRAAIRDAKQLRCFREGKGRAFQHALRTDMLPDALNRLTSLTYQTSLLS